MRTEWNERAKEDAYYYVAFGRRDQDESEFLATGADVVHGLEAELKRLVPGDRRERRALEIGCGPGRLMMPMSWNFGEIHGVDVSDEMIRRAMRALHDIPNAFPRLTRGTGLSMFGDEMFDFVYSYAVFQHIPSDEIVFTYLHDARRIMKQNAILRFQVNGLPKTAKTYTTWEGARLSAGEIAEFACSNDMQLLAMEGVDTQYTWVTMRKRDAGWFHQLAENPPEANLRIRRITNAQSGEPAVPASGRFASFSLWVEDLPDDCDLNQLNITVDEVEAAPVYIGPDVNGLRQVNAMMPQGMRTGLIPVEISWFGKQVCEPAWMRAVPPGPLVPRIIQVSDGINLLSQSFIQTRSVKLYLEEAIALDRLDVRVDGQAVTDLDVFCTNPLNQQYEVNFNLPVEIRGGSHDVQLTLGRRRFAPIEIQVAD
jgi:SAM-dependent methyltransferase